MKLYFESWVNEASIRGKEIDLTNKEHSIAYALKNNPELNEVMDDLLVGKIDWKSVRDRVINIITSLDNVSEQQKRQAKAKLLMVKGQNGFISSVGTYMTGTVADPVQAEKRRKRN